MLTPVNVQISSQSSASANTKGSEGDNGFGALLSDTRARRQSDTAASTVDTDTRPAPVSRQQARRDDTDTQDQRATLPAGSGVTRTADARQPLLPGSARQTLSSALEQLQGNRLEGREAHEAPSLTRRADPARGTDRAATSLTDRAAAEDTRQTRLALPAEGRQPLDKPSDDRAATPLTDRATAEDTRQTRLALLAEGRQPLDKPSAGQTAQVLPGTDKSMPIRADGRTEPVGDRNKRLTDSESADDANPLYALVDTGFLMQGAPTQKAPAGREGAQPTRGAMLEQGLRGRDATLLDSASNALKGRDQEAARSERMFGEILSQREGPLSSTMGTGAEKIFETRSTTLNVNDSPLNTLSALTGQTATSPMVPGTAQAVATATLPAMDSDQWSSAFERQVINLSLRGGGEARLNMNPLELGPLSISLKMGEQSAQLHIASHHAQVRAAIEAALPQLRDAFSASGIELGQTSVSDQGSFQQGGFQQQQERTSGALAGLDTAGATQGTPADADSEMISISPPIGRSLNGGIDLFA